MSNPVFNLPHTPLRPGVRLLEANAGTGKTYNISGLVCRLVIEEGLEISKILVVTFTEAATEELKERVRQRLQNTLASLQSNRAKDDLSKVYLEWPAHQRDRAIKRLKAAVGLFDEAAIFTIHGFCHRALLQYAFECNHLFEPQLIKAPSPLYLELCRDYWRRHFYRGDPFLAALAHCLDLSPKGLVEDFKAISKLNNPRIIPAVSESRYHQALSDLKEIWDDLGDAIPTQDEIVRIFGVPKVFKNKLREKLPEILRFLQPPWPKIPTGPAARILPRLTACNVQDQCNKRETKKGFDPSHPFFERVENWCDALEVFRHQHSFYFLSHFRKQLKRRKDELNIVTFDDLLPGVLQALQGPSGERLKSRLKTHYAAALIDEFQDTDSQQYRLFSKLFDSPEHHLYFIGDPKQAIYTFRGAEIFSYLEARQSARETFGLTTNWRSDPKVVAGVNKLFQRHATPFAFPEIPFNPSDSGVKGGQFKDPNGRNGAGLKFCYLKSDQDGKLLDKASAKEAIRKAVIQEILYLIQRGGLLRGQPIKPGDLAILTRTNEEALEIRQDLSAVNLPSVVHSDQIIFETEEAETLRALLYAMTEPNRVGRFKAAMASEWMGYGSHDLYSMETEGESWESSHLLLRECHEIWLERGIYPALNLWMKQCHIPVRLLGLPEGERKLTNLMHLIDLLQKAESEGRTTPQNLLDWYEDTLLEPDRERDDFCMRLETDAEAIKVMTIHKSKGLQYPIVFVPFAWNTSSRNSKKDPMKYHDPQDTSRIVFDASPEPSLKALEQQSREKFSDRLRLLYVALTRAEFRSYLFWGDFKDQAQSSIGYLLGMADLSGQGAHKTPAPVWERFTRDTPKEIEILNIRTMAGRQAEPHRRYEPNFNLSARSLTRKLEPGFSIASFSSLSPGFTQGAKTSDPEKPEYEPESRNIFSLPRGAITGNIIHQIFQQTDFQKEETLRLATEESCQQHYVESEWTEILHDQLNLVLHKPLGNTSKPVVLHQIGPDSCIKEAQFYFPSENCRIKDLARILLKDPDRFSKTFVDALPHLKEQKVDGFLRGFIDLVFEQHGQFFLLDWKSNWLGPSEDDYGSRSLERAMKKHAYYLQYYLYTVALIRYLRRRLPSFEFQRDFGGVYYLFVRGMSQNSDSNGIFFDKPPEPIIAELNHFFGENG